MSASTAAARAEAPYTVHAACLFDFADASLLPPPAEAYELDISDTAVRGLTLGASLLSAAFAVAGLLLAGTAG